MDAFDYRSIERSPREEARYAPTWLTLKRRRATSSLLLQLAGPFIAALFFAAMYRAYFAVFLGWLTVTVISVVAASRLRCPRCNRASAFVRRMELRSKCRWCGLAIGALSPAEVAEQENVVRVQAALAAAYHPVRQRSAPMRNPPTSG